MTTNPVETTIPMAGISGDTTPADSTIMPSPAETVTSIHQPVIIAEKTDIHRPQTANTFESHRDNIQMLRRGSLRRGSMADEKGSICSHPAHHPHHSGLLRRIDLRLVPILSCLYLLLFLCRQNIGNAKVGPIFPACRIAY